MFSPDWERFSGESVITAMGQAFSRSASVWVQLRHYAWGPLSLVQQPRSRARHLGRTNVWTRIFPGVANGLESAAGPG